MTQEVSNLKMVGQFHLKSLQSLHVFPSTNSMKIKTILHSHIFQHMWQVLRALTKMKSVVMQLLNKDKESNNTSYLDTIKKMKARKKKKKFFSTITMHYNWCSNSVIPMPQPEVVVDECHSIHDYYDSTWNATLEGEDYGGQDGLGPQLSGYLQWLEEKVPENCTDDVDEIDKLADKFIASCHEKFRLEKQESYRRYQEMLARSM